MNALSSIPTPNADCNGTSTAPHSPDWPAERLAEARGIVADFVHHPDSLIVLACRAIAAQGFPMTIIRNPFDAGGYSLAEMTQAINILPNL